ncbi:hypothetical protein N9L20_06470 [Flavobacteriaceae bacterium]|nr:hypothetical protein [Flavobacteriaceae bacterium]
MKRLILFVTLALLMSFSIHKYYISLTQIEYIEDQKSLQIISSVFIDDLELTFQKEFDSDLKIGEQSNPYIDSLSQIYLDKNLLISINEVPLKLKLIASEVETDELFFYIEVLNIEPFDAMTVRNTILFQEFKTQENIIKSKVGSKNKSVILTRAKAESTLNY